MTDGNDNGSKTKLDDCLLKLNAIGKGKIDHFWV